MRYNNLTGSYESTIGYVTMIRQNMLTQNVEGLRESALPAKAWGITKQYLIQDVMSTATYFTHFEGLHAAHDRLDAILEGW